MDNLSFTLESNTLSRNLKECLSELKKMANFFNTFISTHQEEVETFQKKLNLSQNQVSIHPSILLSNLSGIYSFYTDYISNIKDLMTKINNELINPLTEFSNEQTNIYNENLLKLKNIYIKYTEHKDLLNFAKSNYYKISNEIKIKEAESKLNIKKKGEKIKDDSADLLLKDKMKAKNAEIVYKYELIRYNKNISEINIQYNDIISKIQRAEKSRIYFIKASMDKYRNCIGLYNKYINEFIVILENYVNDDICKKDEKYYMQEVSKFINHSSNNRIPLEKFVSYNDYIGTKSEEENTKAKEEFNYELSNDNKKNENISEEKDLKSFVDNLLNEFLGEDEVNQELMAKIFLVMKLTKFDIDKIIIDSIFQLKTKTSLKFNNLKNLNHLSRILSYITLKNSSILEKNFELNFKIIFLSEKIFYQNKLNNNKIYLSAILSKNKYYRTKDFWKSIMELKLAHKLGDHIERLKILALPEEKKKGFFSKIGNAMGITNSLHKNSMLSKSRILPLIKDYYELEESKVEIVDKMMMQEMQGIIRDCIPNLFKFNFPERDVFDFLSDLSEEYKISNELFKFFVIYANVSSHTIMKQLPENENTISFNNFNIVNFKKKGKIEKKIHLLQNTIPYLIPKDFPNLLLCCKKFNNKLRKKIYAHILQQKDINQNIRLKIWQNILKIDEIKKKFDYKVVLNNAHEPKVKTQISLDMSRTVSENEQNKEENKAKVVDIVYAVSMVNGDIQYCQGMHYIGKFLYEVFGEENAFYILVGIFLHTEYSLVIGKDLDRLNIFFYVFQRMISLFEPELSSYLNSCGVEVNCFLIPWCITLFTGSHHYLKEKEDNSKVILRIMDCFFLKGWKGLMEIGCAVLHFNENTLINLGYEEMIQFLINDILKSDFFSSKNENNIKNIMNNKRISKKLIKNIEDEFMLQSKLKGNKI